MHIILLTIEPGLQQLTVEIRAAALVDIVHNEIETRAGQAGPTRIDILAAEFREAGIDADVFCRLCDEQGLSVAQHPDIISVMVSSQRPTG